MARDSGILFSFLQRQRMCTSDARHQKETHLAPKDDGKCSEYVCIVERPRKNEKNTRTNQQFSGGSDRDIFQNTQLFLCFNRIRARQRPGTTLPSIECLCCYEIWNIFSSLVLYKILTTASCIPHSWYSPLCRSRFLLFYRSQRLCKNILLCRNKNKKIFKKKTHILLDFFITLL